MRVIPIGCIREGMILGKSLFGKNGEILLKKDTKLESRYIQKLCKLGYNGIFIEDEISMGIVEPSIVSDELKNKTVHKIKDYFTEVSKGKPTSKKFRNDIASLLNDIIDEMLGNSDMVYNMFDLRIYDNYTFRHCVNVAILSILIGISMGFEKDEIFELGLSALMHDIGKVFIPVEILNKPGRLTSLEYKIMKSHAKKGYEYLRESFYLPTKSYVSVLTHHERYDGSGYPDGCSGNDISLFSRIMAICDVYDALISDRPYRKALLPSEAIEYFMGSYGKLFDPCVTQIFLKKIVPYPLGIIVKTSDNRIGIVIQITQEYFMRPKLRIFKENDKIIKPYILDMTNDKNLLSVTITEVVNIDN